MIRLVPHDRELNEKQKAFVKKTYEQGKNAFIVKYTFIATLTWLIIMAVMGWFQARLFGVGLAFVLSIVWGIHQYLFWQNYWTQIEKLYHQLLDQESISIS